MMYYVDRMSNVRPEFLINSFTAHRFLITAAIVAAKVLSDSVIDTMLFARVGGVDAAELRRLVRHFLCYMEWRVVPHPDIIVAYYRGLIDRSEDYTLAPA